MEKTIHHINFLVKDLEQAVQRYQDALQLAPAEFESLTGRAVRTARFKFGSSWLVLIEPLDKKSVPAQHLAKHGEGFFLLSIGTDNLDREIDRLADNSVVGPLGEKRGGLDSWSVADFPEDALFGAQLQLCEDSDA